MPAIPLVGLGVSAFMNYKQAKSMGKQADQQSALMNKQSGIADQQSALSREMSGFGRDQYAMGQPAISKVMQYYTQLAGGNRGMMDSALAGDRNQAAESYAGAERGMTSHMAPGPGRDRAIAELYRKKAGDMGMMPFMAKQNAMGQLGQMGNAAMERGTQMYGVAGTALNGAAQTNTGAGALNESTANMRTSAANSWGQLISNGTQAADGIYKWYQGRQNGYSSKGPYASGYKF